MNNSNLSGIVAMLAAVVCFALMDAALKLLSPHYPALQVAALRALASLPLVCVWVAWRGGFATLWQVRWRLHLLRGVLGIAMLTLFTFGLRQLPLAEAYSIFFIAPLLIAALSVPLLGEKVDFPRWLAIGAGLAGVFVILRPSSAGMVTLAGLAVLTAAVCYAISAITVRVLARTDSSESMVFWLMVLIALGAAALAAPEWVPLRRQDAQVIAALAVTGFLGQIAITEAFRRAAASAIAPFEYSALVWAMGLDWLLWSMLPDRFMLLGASIVILSGIYLVHRERRHAESEHR